MPHTHVSILIIRNWYSRPISGLSTNNQGTHPHSTPIVIISYHRFPFPWYFSSWTSGAPHHPGFSFQILSIYLLCAMSLAQLFFGRKSIECFTTTTTTTTTTFFVSSTTSHLTLSWSLCNSDHGTPNPENVTSYFTRTSYTCVTYHYSVMNPQFLQTGLSLRTINFSK
jgi:hypothetical protein